MTALHPTHVGGPTALLEVGRRRPLTDPPFDPPGAATAWAGVRRRAKAPGRRSPRTTSGPIDSVPLTRDHHADDAGQALFPWGARRPRDGRRRGAGRTPSLTERDDDGD